MNQICKDRGSAIGKIITIDGSNDGMTEFQIRDRGCNSRRLRQVQFSRLSARHRAERAGTRTDVSQDHECCCSVRAPAFGDVRAHRIFANGVQFMGLQDPSNFEVGVAAGDADLQPIRTFFHPFNYTCLIYISSLHNGGPDS
jgi:hypothetical protein